ncbi:MAG TPA: FHA domain-containing protein [Polyangiaceae bacterium]|nr:FHA domain-containing protein [Polyangiaceae bacterium]
MLTTVILPTPVARLRQRDALSSHELSAETIVGRATTALVRLQQSFVSSHHASLRWTERRFWELRDLQSKNGTFVNGVRVLVGEKVQLTQGDEIGFGSAAEAFVLEDVSAPRPMLLAVEGEAAPIFLEQSLIALPSREEPEVTLFHAANGQWHVESRDLAGPLKDGDLIRTSQASWRCCLPTAPDETDALDRFPSLFALADVELRLHVPRDEEQIELALFAGNRELSLGVKACYYLLLTLSRCRLHRDLPASTEVGEDGWISVAALLDLLRVSEQRLNVDIFRIRQELRSAGVIDAGGVVERQPQRRLLRLGTARVSFHSDS